MQDREYLFTTKYSIIRVFRIPYYEGYLVTLKIHLKNASHNLLFSTIKPATCTSETPIYNIAQTQKL